MHLCSPLRPVALAVLAGLASAPLAAQEAAAPAPELPVGYTAPGQEDAGRVIVLNKAAHTAMVIDVATGETLATLKTGVGPHEVAVHPEGRFAVVANYGEQEMGSSLSVIDLATLELVGGIDLGAPIRPHGLAFEPDGKHLWVSAEVVRQAWRVSFPGGEVVAKVDSEANATHMVAWAPNGRVFTANIGSGSTSVIGPDGEGGFKLLAKVPTGAEAEGVCVTPDGRHVWVSNRREGTVSVLDAESLKLVTELPCEGFPIRAMASPDGRLVLVTSAIAGKLSLFDAVEPAFLGAIEMPFQVGEEGDAILGQMGESPIPIGVSLHASGKLAFVANAAVDRVAVVDLIRRKVVAQLPAGRGPDGIAWVPSPRAR